MNESGVDAPRPSDARSDRESGRLSRQILGRLRERIFQGEYPPGSRLPSETSLATEFGVSRPVLREALACLQEEALIFVRRGSGSYVQEIESASKPMPLPLASLADLQRCFEVRLVLEPRAAALAAERYAPNQREAIEAKLRALHDAGENGENQSEADLAFHLEIAAASGNPYFRDMLSILKTHIVFGMALTRSFGRQLPTGAWSPAGEEHALIADAVIRRDAARAESAMADHLARTRQRVFGAEHAKAFQPT
jgi:DNA-binding FadR family transcriptional regulator